MGQETSRIDSAEGEEERPLQAGFQNQQDRDGGGGERHQSPDLSRKARKKKKKRSSTNTECVDDAGNNQDNAIDGTEERRRERKLKKSKRRGSEEKPRTKKRKHRKSQESAENSTQPPREDATEQHQDAQSELKEPEKATEAAELAQPATTSTDQPAAPEPSEAEDPTANVSSIVQILNGHRKADEDTSSQQGQSGEANMPDAAMTLDAPSTDVHDTPPAAEYGNAEHQLAEHNESGAVPNGDNPLGSSHKSKRRRSEDEAANSPSKRSRTQLRVKKPIGKRTNIKVEEEPASVALAESSSAKKDKSQRKPRVNVPKSQNAIEEGRSGGKFQDRELKAIKQEMRRYREMHDMSEREQNDIIQGSARNPQFVEMLNMVCDLMPRRPRLTVIKFCRRRFHNFQVRGRWSAEDDAELKEAYALYPQTWSKIAARLNRHPEDCRDRWRNYLICGDNINLDYWSVEEETAFSKAIQECLSLVRELKRSGMLQFNNNEDRAKYAEDSLADVDLIDWQQVSLMMNRRRSRLQCIQKWKQMANRGRVGNEKIIRRTRRPSVADKRLQEMPADDKLKILHGIRESNAVRETKIQWADIGDVELQRQWKPAARKAAFEKMKELVDDADSYNLQKLVDILIDSFERDDSTAEALRRMKRRESRLTSRDAEGEVDNADAALQLTTKRKKELSAAKISPEDDDEDADGVSEPEAERGAKKRQPGTTAASAEDGEADADGSPSPETKARADAGETETKEKRRKARRHGSKKSARTSSEHKTKLADKMAREFDGLGGAGDADATSD